MHDQSYLDQCYFIDKHVYNCPFCKRNNVSYLIEREYDFNWSNEKNCKAFFVKCSSCQNTSMHLTFNMALLEFNRYSTRHSYSFTQDKDIDKSIFYSAPTSFFVLDERIPRIVRELITEAEGCLKMNYLTGASACMRKAIYELLILEEAEGINYDERIKALKAKYPNIEPEFFDALAHIKDMTSDKVHEQSWDKWDTKNLKFIIETLKAVLFDIYVIPAIRLERTQNVLRLKQEVGKNKNTKSEKS